MMTEPLGVMGAVERDDCAKLKELLSSKRDSYSISQLAKCLHMASLWGHDECVKILLDAGTHVNIHDINGFTPLIVAVRQDHVTIVKTLIEAKCNVNKATHLSHATPLHYAASDGSIESIRLLVDGGADVEAQMSSGRTPLMAACRSGNEKAVAFLLQSGANVDKTDNDRAIALHFAAEENNIECVRHLLNAHANTNLVTKYGDSAMALAARSGNLDIIELLLNDKTKTSQPRRNMTALHWASEGGHIDCLQLLLNHNTSEVNLATRQQYNRGDFNVNRGVTPLMLASRAGYSRAIEVLIEHGADVDSVDHEGYTSLLYATKHNNASCVESLLCAKSNVNGNLSPSNEESRFISPLLTAIRNESVDALKILIRANCFIDNPGYLEIDGKPIHPMVLVSDVQDNAVRICQIFALAQCQNPDLVKSRLHLMELEYLSTDDVMTLTSSSSSASSLLHLCRYAIRQYMGSNFFLQLPSLPIPTSLKSFLLLNEITEDF